MLAYDTDWGLFQQVATTPCTFWTLYVEINLSNRQRPPKYVILSHT